LALGSHVLVAHGADARTPASARAVWRWFGLVRAGQLQKQRNGWPTDERVLMARLVPAAPTWSLTPSKMQASGGTDSKLPRSAPSRYGAHPGP